jgi:type I restriction enzyme S subunit
MRKGWTETSLGEVAALTMGRTPSRSDKTYWTEDLAYPFCTIADMDGKFIFPKREGVTIKAIQDGKAKIAPTGTLLMSFKLTIGRMGFAGQDIFPNEAIVSITPDSTIALDMFLYCLLGFQDLTAGSGRAIKGETLNSKSLSAIPIFLPPLAEQKRIVDVVSSVDAYIDALQHQADTARVARNAVLQDLLSAGGGDWTETVLGALVSLKTGKLDVNAGVEDGEFPFFTCARDTYKIDVAAYSGKSVIVAGNGDLNVKYYEGEFNAYQRTYILQAIDDLVLDPKFLFHFMDKYVETLRNDTQGSTIQYLKKAQFTEAPISLPSLAEQKRIVEIVSSMDEVIQSTEQAVLDAKVLRTALLSDLLSGNHEIPASYDSLVGAA